VVVDKDNTTIVEGAARRRRSRAASSRSAPRSRRRLGLRSRELQERLAKLAGGVRDQGRRGDRDGDEGEKARVEDALNATRAAVEEGIVPGGGVALLRSAKSIDGLKLAGDEKVGAMIVKRALESPFARSSRTPASRQRDRREGEE